MESRGWFQVNRHFQGAAPEDPAASRSPVRGESVVPDWLRAFPKFPNPGTRKSAARLLIQCFSLSSMRGSGCIGLPRRLPSSLSSLYLLLGLMVSLRSRDSISLL